MKKSLYALLLALALTKLPLLAQTYDFTENSQSPAAEALADQNQESTDAGPFTIDIWGDYIGRSKITKHRYKHQHIRFNNFEVDFGMVFYYNPVCKEAANIEIGYNETEIDWRENPYTSQRNFRTINFSVGAATKRMDNWLWKGKITLNMDVDHFNFNQYATWDALAWGRYTYCEDVGIHMGFIILTGMKIDHFYPIVGFDWEFAEQWKLNAVFPVNISLIYAFNENWSIDLAARGWEVRFRTGKKQPLSKALLEYRNKGIELGLNYDIEHRLHIDVHAGYTVGGKLKIANRQNRHNHHAPFEGAPYVGGEIEWRF